MEALFAQAAISSSDTTANGSRTPGEVMWSGKPTGRYWCFWCFPPMKQTNDNDDSGQLISVIRPEGCR